MEARFEPFSQYGCETRAYWNAGKMEFLQLLHWIQEEPRRQTYDIEGLVRFLFNAKGEFIAWSGGFSHGCMLAELGWDWDNAIKGYVDLYRYEGKWIKSWRVNGGYQDSELYPYLENYFMDKVSGGLEKRDYNDYNRGDGLRPDNPREY